MPRRSTRLEEIQQPSPKRRQTAAISKTKIPEKAASNKTPKRITNTLKKTKTIKEGTPAFNTRVSISTSKARNSASKTRTSAFKTRTPNISKIIDINDDDNDINDNTNEENNNISTDGDVGDGDDNINYDDDNLDGDNNNISDNDINGNNVNIDNDNINNYNNDNKDKDDDKNDNDDDKNDNDDNDDDDSDVNDDDDNYINNDNCNNTNSKISNLLRLLRTDDKQAKKNKKKVLAPSQSILSQFDNYYELVVFMANNPHLLKMAIELHHLQKNKNGISGVFSELLISPNKGKEQARIWLEECKCLFLRARSPISSAFHDFVTAIFNYKKGTDEAVEIVKHTKKEFSDFRNTYNNDIMALVSSYKDKQTSNVLLDADIKAFIDEDVAKKILSRYIAACDRKYFEQYRNIAIIVKLVRESFRISFNGRNINGIKELDILTKKMKVLSLSGRNIASKLEL